MIAITLEYKLFGLLWRRKIETVLPERWTEITAEQLAAIPLLHRGTLSDSKLMQIFLSIKRPVAKRISSFQRYCITKNLSFLKDPQPIGYFIIKNIAGFRSPGANLKGVTFGAFIFGDTYYQNYLLGSRKDLDKFIACYYLDTKSFDENLIEKKVQLIKLTDLATREAIAINYGLIREWLAEKHPYVFQKSETGTKAEKIPGWVKVFDRVVGNDIIHQQDYANLPAMEVLRYLNETTKEFYKNGGKV